MRARDFEAIRVDGKLPGDDLLLLTGIFDQLLGQASVSREAIIQPVT